MDKLPEPPQLRQGQGGRVRSLAGAEETYEKHEGYRLVTCMEDALEPASLRSVEIN